MKKSIKSLRISEEITPLVQKAVVLKTCYIVRRFLRMKLIETKEEQLWARVNSLPTESEPKPHKNPRGRLKFTNTSAEYVSQVK